MEPSNKKLTKREQAVINSLRKGAQRADRRGFNGVPLSELACDWYSANTCWIDGPWGYYEELCAAGMGKTFALLLAHAIEDGDAAHP